MSFNAKDMTQGGQIASMRIRMFSQIANTLTVLSRTCCRVLRFWPREFFPLFYAVHLAVIGLMVM